MSGTKVAKVNLLYPLNEPQFLSKLPDKSFFDEMFDGSKNKEVYDFYKPIYDRIGGLSASEFEEKKKQADSSFLEHGVTFTVYGDETGTERIFPFDLIPRVIPDAEWQKVEEDYDNVFWH